MLKVRTNNVMVPKCPRVFHDENKAELTVSKLIWSLGACVRGRKNLGHIVARLCLPDIEIGGHVISGNELRDQRDTND